MALGNWQLNHICFFFELTMRFNYDGSLAMPEYTCYKNMKKARLIPGQTGDWKFSRIKGILAPTDQWWCQCWLGAEMLLKSTDLKLHQSVILDEGFIIWVCNELSCESVAPLGYITCNVNYFL